MLQLTQEMLKDGVRPIAGKCVVEFEKVEAAGSTIIPEAARGPKVRIGSKDAKETDTAYIGKVLAVTPRKTKSGKEFDEDFQVGDKVAVMLLLEDVEKKVILTDNRRVYAVIVDA